MMMEYNRVKQKYKRQYQDKIRYKLETFHSNKPVLYWNLWRSLKPKPVHNSKLTLQQFDTYYREQVKPPPTDYF